MSRRANRATKRSLFYLLLRMLGVTRFWRWRQRHNVTILFLHGAMSDADGQGVKPTRWQLDPVVLDSYLKDLGRHYEFVSMDQAFEVVAGRRKPGKNLLAITIDDGYQNAATHAWPVLQANNVPATVYVTSGQMSAAEPFWWDRLDYAMLHSDESMSEVQIGRHTIPVDLSDRESIQRSSKNLIFRSRELFDNEMQRIKEMLGLTLRLEKADKVAALKTWVGVMNSQEVQALSLAGMTIGSHSDNHVRLKFCESEEIREEVTVSKREIESVTGIECRQFCYPEGAFDSRVVTAVRKAGYHCALTTENGHNPVGQDPYRLKRIHLPEKATTSELLATVCSLDLVYSGLRAWLAGRVRSRRLTSGA